MGKLIITSSYDNHQVEVFDAATIEDAYLAAIHDAVKNASPAYLLALVSAWHYPIVAEVRSSPWEVFTYRFVP